MSGSNNWLYVALVGLVAVVAVFVLFSAPSGVAPISEPVIQESSPSNLIGNAGATPPPTKVVSCHDTDGSDGRNIAVNGYVTFTFDNGRTLTLDESKYVRTGTLFHNPVNIDEAATNFWNANSGWPVIANIFNLLKFKCSTIS